MASLATNDFKIPESVANDIWHKAFEGSTLATLADRQPQKFGKGNVMVLTGEPRAELVGEGAEKSPTPPTFENKTVTPHKLQVTVRMNEEVKWADEDHQLDIFDTVTEACGNALARALDLVGYHKLNPLTGAVASTVTEGITDTSNTTVLANGKYDEAVEAAEALVIAEGYDPNGLAVSPTFAFGLKTQKDADGRRIYPALGAEFDGMKLAKSSTVNAPEATVDTDVLAITGDFSAFRWGIQREIGFQLIEFGDPDGLGDLKRNNQIALRMEIVYGIGIMDTDAFAVVKSK